MMLLPRSAFGQTVALAMTVVLFATVSAIVIVVQAVGPKRADTIAALTELAFSGVESVPAGDNDALTAFANARGIRWTKGDLPGRQAPAFGRFRSRLNQALSSRFGSEVEFRFVARAEPNFWIRLDAWPDLWLAPPGAGRISVLRWSILGWLGVTLLFSILLSVVFAMRLTGPLRRLQAATNALPEGHASFDLKPEGPREVRALTRSFAAAVAQLRQAEADREVLLAGMSHDMRTPLARMRVGVEMLDREDDELVRGIVHDIDELDSITAQFLAYVREGRVEPVEPVDVAAVLRAVATDLGREGHHVEVAAQPVEELMLGPLGIRRLISNLLHNAVRHGAPPVQADVRPTPGHDGVVLTVGDAGPGLTDAQWAVLTGRSTALLPSDGGRIGFGLHIMRRIIRRHGAWLSREVAPGCHRIRIEFPRNRASA